MVNMGRREGYERASEILRVLSHPDRLQIADEVRMREACVCHLQTVLDRSQPYVSQQLGVLRDANVVRRRREGPFVYYRLAHPEVEGVVETLLGPPDPQLLSETCPCPRCVKASAEGKAGRGGG